MVDLSESKQAFFYVNTQINSCLLKKDSNTSLFREDVYKKWLDQKQFYIFSEKLRKDAELDFTLFALLLHDKIFLNESDEVQKRIKYYYFYYVCFLLDNSICSNNLEKIALYKKKKPNKHLSEQRETSRHGQLQQKILTLHISVICDGISYINANRLSTLFCRLTWKNIWLYTQNNGLLDPVQKSSGLKVNVEILDLPVQLYAILSVITYTIRLILQVSFLLKHVCFPTDLEKCISIKERFFKEWYLRHWSIINDLVTAFINTLINFSDYWKIPGNYIPGLIITLLIFDLAKIVYLFYVEQTTYKIKKNQFNENRMVLSKNDKKILDLLSHQLNCHHSEINGKLLFCIVLNTLLLSNFILSLFFTAPISIPIFFFISTIIISVAQSAEHFGIYMRACKDHENNINDEEKAIFKYKKRNEFYMTVCKKFFVPFLTTGMFVVNWPIASILIFIYMLYEWRQWHYFRNRVPRPDNFFFKEQSLDNLKYTDDLGVTNVFMY